MDCFSARRKLTRDAFRDELRVDVGVLDLDDVERNSLADSLFEVCLQLFDLCAAAADDHTGLCHVDVDAHALGVALDLHLRDTCGSKGCEEIFTKLIVFHEGVAEVFFLRIPTRFPVLDHADSVAVGINFLTHCFTSSSIIPLP